MFDVAVIGAGVVGAGAARELSRRRLDVVVLEKGFDAASGASKANSGIVHAGYDAVPGTLKAKYNMLGNPLFDSLSAELDFPFRRIGALVLGLSDADLECLEMLRDRGGINGVAGLEIIGRDRLLDMEPNLGDRVLHGLFVPGSGIVSPYEMTIALAENAAANGVRFRFGCRVEGMEKAADGFCLHTSEGEIAARLVVNAAGVHSGAVNNMLSARAISIIPRRGQYCLLDRSEGGLARHTLFQVPGEMGKGVLVTPTVDGNILVGPNSEEVRDKEDVSTTGGGLEYVIAAGSRILKAFPAGSVISSFSGLRAHSAGDDFIVGHAPDVPGLINLCGVESPGLTSAPALAREAERLVTEALSPRTNAGFNPVRRAAGRFRLMTDEERSGMIAADPDYGRIVCRCENVSGAEVKAALRSPLGAASMDAVKRRTRAGMGRCQGGFCSMRLPEIIAGELGVPVAEVVKSDPGSALLSRRNKDRL